MAGLPRRFAKMGFTKGWKAYKASKSTRSSAHRQVNSMARRSFSRARAAFRATKRYARRGTATGAGQLVQIDAMAYGALRAPLSNATSSLLGGVLGGLPGAIGDEVTVGLVDWLIAKNTSGIVRNIALKGLAVENARIGESLSQGFFNKVAPSSAVASNAVNGWT